MKYFIKKYNTTIIIFSKSFILVYNNIIYTGWFTLLVQLFFSTYICGIGGGRPYRVIDQYNMKNYS